MSPIMLFRRKRIPFFVLTGQRVHFKMCEHLDSLSQWANQNNISLGAGYFIRGFYITGFPGAGC